MLFLQATIEKWKKEATTFFQWVSNLSSKKYMTFSQLGLRVTTPWNNTEFIQLWDRTPWRHLAQWSSTFNKRVMDNFGVNQQIKLRNACCNISAHCAKGINSFICSLTEKLNQVRWYHTCGVVSVTMTSCKDSHALIRSIEFPDRTPWVAQEITQAAPFSLRRFAAFTVVIA